MNLDGLIERTDAFLRGGSAEAFILAQGHELFSFNPWTQQRTPLGTTRGRPVGLASDGKKSILLTHDDSYLRLISSEPSARKWLTTLQVIACDVNQVLLYDGSCQMPVSLSTPNPVPLTRIPATMPQKEYFLRPNGYLETIREVSVPHGDLATTPLFRDSVTGRNYRTEGPLVYFSGTLFDVGAGIPIDGAMALNNSLAPLPPIQSSVTNYRDAAVLCVDEASRDYLLVILPSSSGWCLPIPSDRYDAALAAIGTGSFLFSVVDKSHRREKVAFGRLSSLDEQDDYLGTLDDGYTFVGQHAIPLEHIPALVSQFDNA